MNPIKTGTTYTGQVYIPHTHQKREEIILTNGGFRSVRAARKLEAAMFPGQKLRAYRNQTSIVKQEEIR